MRHFPAFSINSKVRFDRYLQSRVARTQPAARRVGVHVPHSEPGMSVAQEYVCANQPGTWQNLTIMHQVSLIGAADLIRGGSRHAARSPAALKTLPLLLAALFLVAGAPAFGIGTPWRVATGSWREKPRTSKSTKSALPARPLIATSERMADVMFAEALQRSLDDQIEEALAKGETDTVRKLLADFLTEPRVPAEILLRTGASLAEHDLYPEAAKVFDRAVKDFPQLFEGYYNLALAELALREFSDALATLAKAPPTSPSGEVARSYLRGKIEAALGKNTEAERD